MIEPGLEGGRAVSEPPSTESLELELRQLPGIESVSFIRRDEVTLIEISTDGSLGGEDVTREVAGVAQAYLDTEIEVSLIDDLPAGSAFHEDGPKAPSQSPRVQLVTTVAAPGEIGRLEIHLAHQGRRTVAGAGPQDRVELAEAVIAGLRRLGFPVPYEVEAVHALSADLGAGVLVVMVDRSTGERRRGLADRRSLEDAVPCAVLNGLNRYLQTAERAP